MEVAQYISVYSTMFEHTNSETSMNYINYYYIPENNIKKQRASKRSEPDSRRRKKSSKRLI